MTEGELNRLKTELVDELKTFISKTFATKSEMTALFGALDTKFDALDAKVDGLASFVFNTVETYSEDHDQKINAHEVRLLKLEYAKI